MTSPGDDSRTELAWREIVENYGERASYDSSSDDDPAPDALPAPRDREPAADGVPTSADDAEVEPRERAIAKVDRFRPRRRPHSRSPAPGSAALAWAGIFVAPLIALVIGLLSIYVPPLVGWVLVAWIVGGFGYLVLEMPKSPRDPWDDGSRI